MDGTSLFIVAEINEGAADILIIDPKENMIYWINVEENVVEKIDFDGNYRETYTSPRLYPFIIKLVSNYLHSVFIRIRARLEMVSRRVVSSVSEQQLHIIK